MKEIGLGGGCHWCTEAVFQALKGVLEVKQGYLASTGEATSFSEGVLLTYDSRIISLKTLIEIHLHTHESTSNHSFRTKYRSAVYFIHPEDEDASTQVIEELQADFNREIITEVLPFKNFKASREALQDYYRSDPDRPFCKRYIEPKLQLLLQHFGKDLKERE